MAVSVSKFNVPGTTDAALVSPKLSYRFRVTFTQLGEGDETELTSQVVSVSRPSVTHDDIVLDVYNSRIFMAGKHTWDPITLTVRDDITGAVGNQLAKQLQKQMDHSAQSGQNSGGNYKFVTIIDNLDGSSETNVLDSWELAGCYIQNINYGENNYATSDPLVITVMIKFDNANHSIGGTAALEGTGGITETDNSTTGNN
jgi:hypothetical protein